MVVSSERIDPEQWQADPTRQAILVRHIYAYQCFIRQCRPADRCLDYGCGDGYGAYLLAQSAGAVNAVDPDQDAVQQAKNKYRRHNLSFEKIGEPPLPFPDSSFDVVISAQVIEHLKDPQTYIREIRRLLKSGGRLLLTTPNKKIRLRGERPWNRFHVREFSAQDLQLLLSGHFAQLKISGIYGRPEIMKLERKRVKRRQAISALDFFSLRKLLPSTREYKIISVFSKISRLGHRKNKAQPPAFTVADFRLDDQPDDSLDLLAAASK